MDAIACCWRFGESLAIRRPVNSGNLDCIRLRKQEGHIHGVRRLLDLTEFKSGPMLWTDSVGVLTVRLVRKFRFARMSLEKYTKQRPGDDFILYESWVIEHCQELNHS